MLVIGVTGGIASGKSFISNAFRLHRFPVFDADKCVHQLMQKNSVVITAIKKAFPKAVKANVVDRAELRKAITKDKKALVKLEDILHPKVREAEKRFLFKNKRLGTRIAVLDIPLLFETGADSLCDVVLVAYCPPALQEKRVMKRAGATKAFLEYIRTKQLKDRQRVLRADFVVNTARSKAYTRHTIKQIIHLLISKK